MRWYSGSRLFALGLLAAMLAACGTSSAAGATATASRAPATPHPTPTPQPSFPPLDHGQIPPEVVGNYAFTVFDKDSEIELLADGTYIMWLPERFGIRPVGVRGEYGVFGDTMRFGNEIAEDSSVRACIGEGTYTWSLEGKTLNLTLVEDECSVAINRQAEWQSGWVRQD
jgi:hypothetical protein